MGVPDMPAPRFGTARNPQRETLGPKVAQVARKLGWELMPWQRYVLDVGCEIDPATGLFWYKDVRILAPRQSGKTSLVVPKAVHRAVTTKNAQIIYTAQNRTKSLRRLEKNFYPRLLEHWAPVLDPKRARSRPGWNGRTGSESIDFVTKSSIFIDAATEKSGQGDTNHEWHGDELYAHQDATIANNIRPTMIAVPGSQAWLVSAAGKMGYSTYWWGLVEDGRAVAEAADPRSRIMYVEWSDEPDADREDRTRWPLYLPAYGITIFEETMDAELQAFRTDLEQYDRAYRGIWTGITKPEPIIPVNAWNDDAWPSTTADPIDWSAPPMWAVDMDPHQEWTSIAVAGKPTRIAADEGRRVALRLVDHEPGSHWVIDRMLDLSSRFGGRKVALAAASQAMSLKLDLEEAGFEVIVIPRAEVAAACGEFFADAVNRRMWHGNDDPLNEALAGAVKRAWGDAWVWWRGRSMADVSPVYGATVARHAYLTNAEPDYNAAESVL